MAELTEKQEARYLETGGVRCPFCGHEELEHGRIQVDAGGAHQDIMCPKCEEEWMDCYTLTHMEKK